MKECKSCKEEFPATLEYFYIKKVNKDGLQGLCKACEKEKQKRYRERNHERLTKVRKEKEAKARRENNIPEKSKLVAREGFKICTKCKTEHPATFEYYHKGNGNDGFYPWCKECKNTYDREKKRRERIIELKTKYDAEEIKGNQMTEKDKEEDIAYWKLINKKVDAGLNLSDLKMELGQVYKITSPIGRKSKQEYFKGTMIQETEQKI